MVGYGSKSAVMLDILEELLGGIFVRHFNLFNERQEPFVEMKSDMLGTAYRLD